MTARRERFDAVIVGARAAGAATAMLLARRGLRVLAVDRSAYGKDALSTHALMRAGVLQLHRWGVLEAVRAAGTPPVRTTTFHYGDQVLEIAVKERDGVDALYAPRRTVLDALLVDAARASGAEVRYGVRLEGLLRSRDDRARGVVLRGETGEPIEVEAPLVVGADGLRSTVARLVAAPVLREGRHATACVYAYWQGVGLEGYHWYFRPGVSAGAIATNDGASCVFALMSPRRFAEEIRRDTEAGYHRVIAEVDPPLAGALSGARRVSALRSFPGVRGIVRRCWGPGWALVGDASHFKDPSTAHGLSDALRDAELLARAAAQGTDAAFAQYEETRDALSHDFFEATDAISSLSWDLESLPALHVRANEAMKREVAAIVTLTRSSGTPDPASTPRRSRLAASG